MNIVKLSASMMLATFIVLPILAFGATRSANIDSRITQIKERADQEIERRITALSKLKSRVGEARKVSDSVKQSMSSNVDVEISNLTSLKSRIDSDGDIETLRTDVKSITASYRIFALIIPQGRILAAADRINIIADQLKSVGVKLELRISQAKSEGKNVTSLENYLADFNSKLNDAKAKAAAASDEVSGLMPDNGDQAKFKANQDALKTARINLKEGTENLKAAREDARKIVKGLKDMGLSKNASASSTAPGRLGD